MVVLYSENLYTISQQDAITANTALYWANGFKLRSFKKTILDLMNQIKEAAIERGKYSIDTEGISALILDEVVTELRRLGYVVTVHEYGEQNTFFKLTICWE